MTRGIAAEVTNQRFGHLLVLRRTSSDPQGNAMWVCRCDCGKEVVIRRNNLRRGQEFCSKQCPLYHSEKLASDIAGQRFGRLVALWLVGRKGNARKAIWRFRCDCGNEIERVADNVVGLHTKSCGCLDAETRLSKTTHGKLATLEYHRAAHRDWALRNPGKVIANVYKRTAALRWRVPRWLSDEQWSQIDAFYAEAKRLTIETCIRHSVDHVIPLRGKTVSGLHVPWNLQVIPHLDNLHKSARLPDEVC